MSDVEEFDVNNDIVSTEQAPAIAKKAKIPYSDKQKANLQKARQAKAAKAAERKKAVEDPAQTAAPESESEVEVPKVSSKELREKTCKHEKKAKPVEKKKRKQVIYVSDSESESESSVEIVRKVVAKKKAKKVVSPKKLKRVPASPKKTRTKAKFKEIERAHVPDPDIHWQGPLYGGIFG